MKEDEVKQLLTSGILMDEETFDIEQCADFLKVNRTTVLALAGDGELVGAQIGRAWVFLKSDVVEYLRKQTREQVAIRKAQAEAKRREKSALERHTPDVMPVVAKEKPRSGRRKPIPELPSPELCG